MSKVRLWLGINVTVNDETHFCQGPASLWKYLGLGGSQYDQLREQIITQLFDIHKATLAYGETNDHIVVLTVVSNKDIMI